MLGDMRAELRTKCSLRTTGNWRAGPGLAWPGLGMIDGSAR
jgi:uncharacterized protein YraI